MEKEAETKAIYKLTNHLTDAEDLHNIACIAVSAIMDCFSCKAALICFDENGLPEQTFVQQISAKERIWRKVENPAEIKRNVLALQAEFYIGAEFCDWPIYGRESILGVIRLPGDKALIMSDAQRRLITFHH